MARAPDGLRSLDDDGSGHDGNVPARRRPSPQGLDLVDHRGAADQGGRRSGEGEQGDGGAPGRGAVLGDRLTAHTPGGDHRDFRPTDRPRDVGGAQGAAGVDAGGIGAQPPPQRRGDEKEYRQDHRDGGGYEPADEHQSRRPAHHQSSHEDHSAQDEHGQGQQAAHDGAGRAQLGRAAPLVGPRRPADIIVRVGSRAVASARRSGAPGPLQADDVGGGRLIAGTGRVTGIHGARLEDRRGSAQGTSSHERPIDALGRGFGRVPAAGQRWPGAWACGPVLRLRTQPDHERFDGQ